MRRWVVTGVAGAVLLVALIASVQAGYWPRGGGGVPTRTTSCRTCFQGEPVVDVVMPLLGTSGNSTNPNRVINLSLGETKTFEVDIYPTVGLSFEMSFRSVLVSRSSAGSSSGAGANITAAFQPPTLTLGANEKGSTFMTISVPAGAAKGAYDAVVSATSRSNSSDVWGLYFEIAAG